MENVSVVAADTQGQGQQCQLQHGSACNQLDNNTSSNKNSQDRSNSNSNNIHSNHHDNTSNNDTAIHTFCHQSHSLRLSASNIAAMIGCHPFKSLPQLCHELIYQSKSGQALLQHDTCVLQIQLLNEEEMLHSIVQKLVSNNVQQQQQEEPNSIMQQFQHVLAIKRGESIVHNIQHATFLKSNFLQNITNSIKNQNQKQHEQQEQKLPQQEQISTSELNKLTQGIRFAIDTGYGTHHENMALNLYQEQLGCFVYKRNEEIMQWSFIRAEDDDVAAAAAAPDILDPNVNDETNVTEIKNQNNTSIRSNSNNNNNENTIATKTEKTVVSLYKGIFTSRTKYEQQRHDKNETTTNVIQNEGKDNNISEITITTTTTSTSDHENVKGDMNLTLEEESKIIPNLHQHSQQVVDMDVDKTIPIPKECTFPSLSILNNNKQCKNDQQPIQTSLAATSAATPTSIATAASIALHHQEQLPFFTIVGSVDGIRDELWFSTNTTTNNNSHGSNEIPEECISNNNQANTNTETCENTTNSNCRSSPLLSNSNNNNSGGGDYIGNGSNHNIDPDDGWSLRRVIVECKHRMSFKTAKGPPPFYDQIQAVIYCLMYDVDQADLVQVVRRRKAKEEERSAGAAAIRRKIMGKKRGRKCKENNLINAFFPILNNKKDLLNATVEIGMPPPKIGSEQNRSNLRIMAAGQPSDDTTATVRADTLSVGKQGPLTTLPVVVNSANLVDEDKESIFKENDVVMSPGSKSEERHLQSNGNGRSWKNEPVKEMLTTQTSVKPSEVNSEVEIFVSRISLDDPIHRHGEMWHTVVLPRLRSFVEAIYAIRADHKKRHRLLKALSNMDDYNAWHVILDECPWLRNCDIAFYRLP